MKRKLWECEVDPGQKRVGGRFSRNAALKNPFWHFITVAWFFFVPQPPGLSWSGRCRGRWIAFSLVPTRWMTESRIGQKGAYTVSFALTAFAFGSAGFGSVGRAVRWFVLCLSRHRNATDDGRRTGVCRCRVWYRMTKGTADRIQCKRRAWVGSCGFEGIGFDVSWFHGQVVLIIITDLQASIEASQAFQAMRWSWEKWKGLHYTLKGLKIGRKCFDKKSERMKKCLSSSSGCVKENKKETRPAS